MPATIPAMFRAIALVVIGLLVTGGAWLARPDPEFLARQWVKSRVERRLGKLVAAEHRERSIRVAVAADHDDTHLAAMVREVVKVRGIEWAEQADAADHVVHIRLDRGSGTATLAFGVDEESTSVRRVGWYSVVPPLLAIVIAILFRHVILCLVIGIFAGGVIAILPTDHWPIYGFWHAFWSYFVHHALLDTFRAEIIAFVLLISAMVGIAQRSGGIHRVIDWLTRFCRTARGAQIGTVLAGVMIFFDDYMNCIVVGNSLRPLTDRYRVSRAKLAYLVDSTAAPVAGLAVVSTWIAFEMTQIKEGLMAAGLTDEPFQVFIRSLPFRFYCMFTLIMVFIVAWMGRDFGPMLAAERRARQEGVPPEEGDESPAVKDGRGRAVYAVVPLGITMLCIAIGLWWTAQPGPGEPPIEASGTLDYLQQMLGRASSATAFSRAAAIGYALAVIMVLLGGAMNIKQVARASVISVRVILSAVAILFLAWSIGEACRDVGTADYLVAMFREVLNPVGFALVVFGLACLISFSTGSSYSTMAILLPNVVPLAMAVGEGAWMGPFGLITMSIGAVLEGAIFGDHCSPISDTTILSAISSRCDLIEHVRTQMPYALTTMLTAVLAGYVPVALGAPPLVCVGIGATVLFLVMRVLGKRGDAA